MTEVRQMRGYNVSLGDLPFVACVEDTSVKDIARYRSKVISVVHSDLCPGNHGPSSTRVRYS